MLMYGCGTRIALQGVCGKRYTTSIAKEVYVLTGSDLIIMLVTVL